MAEANNTENATPANGQKKNTRWLRYLEVQYYLNWSHVARNLPYILFLTILAILYIGNTHLAEKNIREINNLEKELQELRWEYMTTKSDLMYQSKQSEVAKMVATQGLQELIAPPYKITVNEE